MKLSAEQIQALATELRDYLIDHDLWEDCTIFFNGKAFCFSDQGPNDSRKWYLQESADPGAYTNHVSPIPTVFLGGALCQLLNHWVNDLELVDRLEKDLNRMFSKHGVHYELADHWNMELYEDS